MAGIREGVLVVGDDPRQVDQQLKYPSLDLHWWIGVEGFVVQ